MINLNLYSIKNGLIIEWTKALQHVQLVYSLRCQQTNKILTFFCCIRTHLPYGISPHYSEVCKSSGKKGRYVTSHAYFSSCMILNFSSWILNFFSWILNFFSWNINYSSCQFLNSEFLFFDSD